MKIIEIDKLIPYQNNARTHNKEQLLKLRSSLREFGFVNPVLIDKDYNIIAGHGRVAAAKAEGIKDVPCVMVEHLTEAQKKAYILADNRLAMDAGWDNELLAIELESLKGLNFDLNLTGFEAAEIDELFSNIHDKDVADDEFDVDAALELEPISKLGDIWLLGRHRLICGDSTLAETYERLMEGKKANLCVTDPPYNVNYTAGKENERVIKNDNMDDQSFYEFLLASFKNIYNHLDDGGAAYIFHADTEGLNFRKAFKDAGFKLSGVCQWVKQSLVLGRSDYQWQHEPVLYGWKPTGKHRWYGDRKQTTVWNFDRPTKSELHPTMKPVPLVAYPIQNSSMSNCIVLEPFGGSGSTLIACEQTGRICYAIELDGKYVDVITKRYIDYIGKDDDVFLIRDGEKIKYSDLIKEQ
ncbi:site-specific DNA-methyltransferase [Halalkalibacterium halodurans]|uniref:site-specific DNA-methyltransferase n=1 Tax=Halalkalibacterium halodurans TaxID=86665 RepID=UPI001ABBB081|nr:site-specific DNA-methyltransferase [Halalkalibacterium halodurans]